MSGAPNGPGYTGHVNDPETGLVYMQARYYDPATGRFLSVDPVAPVGGNLFNVNRYDYANNNPINNVDLDGRVVIPANKRAAETLNQARALSAINERQYQTLNNSTNTWKVKVELMSQSHVDADNFEKAKKIADGGTGEGTGGTVFIKRFPSEKVDVADTHNGASRKVKITQSEAIAHEFAHAVQNDAGTTSNDGKTREHEAREVEDQYRQEQKLKGGRNNVKGN